jgi:hypothetical protein
MRRLVAFLLVGACAADNPSRTLAQVGGAMGQGAMAPAGGLVNGAIARFQDLDANGPGWLYYGLNAADRGLGYRGSYMTLGGFIPYAEDDLGGFWSADLRTHLSNYGGFFSNVGFVRKQFIGGAIGGIGVYWDYDGDQNQYSPTTITDSSGSYTFAGGQTYQQVGVSAEFLTDYGNIRSNGYIPVGTTATTMGPFVGNSLLCQYGINAALAGADLEVGAYIPGLSDWAGMVSVGGYAFGNARYNLANGQDVVPYFGGVFTRLDLTLIENWDFSLQANNDSFFDWTGFARLTYRMGGSRRRNVPDQMEQPMMRNEHIVRAHQAPEQAMNPFLTATTGSATPWRVIHVDNAYNAGTTTSAGTVENPVLTLAAAEAKATADYDIVFVHQGISGDQPYAGGFTFQADNQYLVGQGSSLMIPTVDCGLVPIWASGGSAGYPVISNPTGDAIVLTDGVSTNATVDHLKIMDSQVGISDGVGLPAGGRATVNDVRIVGNNPGQTGVLITDAAGNGGTFDFTGMRLQDLTANGFVIDAGGSEPRVNISRYSIRNTIGSAVIVNNVVDSGTTPGLGGRVVLTSGTIDETTGPGVSISGGVALIDTTRMTRIGTAGVAITGSPFVSGSLAASGTSTVQVVDSFIAAAVGVQGSAPNTGDLLNLTINQNTLVSPLGGNGISLAVNDGKINANIVGNNIAARQTTALTTGTAGGPSAPALLASNIYLTTSNTSGGLNNLTIKAASLDNLVALNRNATVTTAPPANPANTGTTATISPPPPPPNYNPSVVVRLPPP